jgi:hypothetical protein
MEKTHLLIMRSSLSSHVGFGLALRKASTLEKSANSTKTELCRSNQRVGLMFPWSINRVYLELFFFVSPHTNGVNPAVFVEELLQTTLQCRILFTKSFLGE